MKLTKKPMSYSVVYMRRRKSNDHVVFLAVYTMPTKEDAKRRANYIRKVGIKKRGEIRYVHVRKIMP